MDCTWQPEPERSKSANVSALMKHLGADSYESLLDISLNQADRYWNAVIDLCGIVWESRPEHVIDAKSDKQFPSWFPGGRINWVNSIYKFSEDSAASQRTAIVAELEDGQVERVSYSELALRVERFAAGLASRGFKRGDRIGIFMENGLEATISFLAIVHLGAIVVPLFSGFGAEAVVSRLAASEARCLIASGGFRRRGKPTDLRLVVEEARKSLPKLELVIWKQNDGRPLLMGDLDWQAVQQSAGADVQPASMDPNDPFMIIFTSGTTGRPKGAVHTHGGFPLKIAHDAFVNFDIKAGDVFCWPADMGWVAGPIVVCSALLLGATLVSYVGSPDIPDWSRLSRIVERHKVTHLGSAPTLIRLLASHERQALAGDRSTLRLLLTAGEVIDPEHFCWFQQRFGGGANPLINYTGGTEVSGGLLSSVVIRPISPGSFNTVVPGVDVDVVDASGKPTIDQVGELIIRAPFIGMTKSFWNDDERYLDTYWKTLPGVWVHGDLALHRSDGSFLIMGRSDDTLKIAGKRVGPAEVEEVVVQVSGVSEVAAVGIDDSTKGQMLVVFISVTAEASTQVSEIEGRVQQHVEKQLGKAFKPARVHAVAQLPKTRSSKIMRRLIRNAYSGLPLGDLTALDNPIALDEIRSVARS